MACNRDNDFTFVKCFALLPVGEGGRRPDEGRRLMPADFGSVISMTKASLRSALIRPHLRACGATLHAVCTFPHWWKGEAVMR